MSDQTPAPRRRWPDIDFTFILILIVGAWTFGMWITLNWEINDVIIRLTAAEARLDKQIDWMKEIQESQATQNKATADLIAAVNQQITAIRVQIAGLPAHKTGGR